MTEETKSIDLKEIGEKFNKFLEDEGIVLVPVLLSPVGYPIPKEQVLGRSWELTIQLSERK